MNGHQKNYIFLTLLACLELTKGNTGTIINQRCRWLDQGIGPYHEF